MHKHYLWLIGLILLVCRPSPANCQYYFYNDDYYESPVTWQSGVLAGGMNCLTDLGGKKGRGRRFIKDVNWRNTCPAAGLFVGMNYKDLIGARLELAVGQIKASDNVLKNDRSAAYSRYKRNLNFRSGIRELAFCTELYPLSIFPLPGANSPMLTPYISFGIGIFSFSPETQYNNTWIPVSDFHTEGQGFREYPGRKMYSLTQYNIPLGVGLKYEASPVLRVQFEIIGRKLWTDYLDDVSSQYIDPALFDQYFPATKAKLAVKLADRRLRTDTDLPPTPGDIRGNEQNNDSYFSGLIRIAFVMGRQKRP